MTVQLQTRNQVSLDLGPSTIQGWTARPVDATSAVEFATRYEEASGNSVQPSMILDGRSRGFWRNGRMVAGYRVGVGARRYAALAEPGAVARWPFAPEEAVEITHLWMDAELPVGARRQVYAWMVADVMGSGRQIVVGGAVDPVLARQQMRSLPFLLEERATSMSGRDVTLWLYYGTITTMLADAVATGVPVPWLGIS